MSNYWPGFTQSPSLAKQVINKLLIYIYSHIYIIKYARQWTFSNSILEAPTGSKHGASQVPLLLPVAPVAPVARCTLLDACLTQKDSQNAERNKPKGRKKKKKKKSTPDGNIYQHVTLTTTDTWKPKKLLIFETQGIIKAKVPHSK